MSSEDGIVHGSETVAASRSASSGITGRLHVGWMTGLVWILGSLVVAAAQPGTDRKAAAFVTAVCGIAAILGVRYLTDDPARRYLRSLLAAVVVVPVAAVWMLRSLLLTAATQINATFYIDGLEKRITLPLMFVLLAPLVVQALPPSLLRPATMWGTTKALCRAARWMDWIFVAYLVVAIPAFLYGIPHRVAWSYFAQDLGLVVFFTFMYIAGRAASSEGALDWADELVDVLLLLALTHFVLLGWGTSPIYNYIEAACTGAIVIALFRPSRRALLPAALAAMILVADAVAVVNGTDSTITVSVLGAVGIVAYILIRRRELIPQWLIVAVAVVALIGFLGFTSDGKTLQGRYHGPNVSNAARTFEARLVRRAVRGSATTLVIGRGLGSTLDMRNAPPSFETTLTNAGRDLAHVPEVHLLVYSFLFKEGLLGVLWLILFAVGLFVLGLQALERTARTRNPSYAVYAALPLLGLVASLAAASHLPANPLNGLSVGLLVACMARSRTAPTA